MFAGVEVALIKQWCSCGDCDIDSARDGNAIPTFPPFDEYFLSVGFMRTLMALLPFDSASYYQQIVCNDNVLYQKNTFVNE